VGGTYDICDRHFGPHILAKAPSTYTWSCVSPHYLRNLDRPNMWSPVHKEIQISTTFVYYIPCAMEDVFLQLGMSSWVLNGCDLDEFKTPLNLKKISSISLWLNCNDLWNRWDKTFWNRVIDTYIGYNWECLVKFLNGSDLDEFKTPLKT